MTFSFSLYLLGLNGELPTLTKKKSVTDYLFVLLSKYLRLQENKAILPLCVKINACSFPIDLSILQIVLISWML